jgi:hypothetical protein
MVCQFPYHPHCPSPIGLYGGGALEAPTTHDQGQALGCLLSFVWGCLPWPIAARYLQPKKTKNVIQQVGDVTFKMQKPKNEEIN